MSPTSLCNKIIRVSDYFKIVFYTGEIISMKGHCKMYNSLLIKICHLQMYVFIDMCMCVLTILALVFEFSHLNNFVLCISVSYCCITTYSKMAWIKTTVVYLVHDSTGWQLSLEPAGQLVFTGLRGQVLGYQGLVGSGWL